MIYPRTFPCMDDDPRNNGNGYNSPNPYDNYPDEMDDETFDPEEIDEPDNEIENDAAD